jgi:hypothetical protein
MSNPIRILSQFKTSLISFIDELIVMFPNESDFIIGRIFINDQVPIEDIINAFSEKIYENNNLLKKMIKERDESFFLKNNVFSFLGDRFKDTPLSLDTIEEKVNKFKDIWLSDTLEESDKITMWKWVDIFVILADRFNNKKNT